MEQFRIQGGRKLRGEVRISGAKNAALPAMAAALLTREPVHLKNIPHVRDIVTMAKLLAHMRCRVESPDIPPSAFTLQAETVSHAEAPYELVKTMRASVLTLGPLLARFGRARVSLPGGCAIGARPIDLHIQALEALGGEISVDHGYVQAQAERLRGARVRFPRITVTGTENILTAAALAEGETILENAALEPEIGDLAELLVEMGAKIEGAGTPTIWIEGVKELHGTEHTIIPDRIEAGTFLVAGAMAGGEITLTHCAPHHLGALIAKLRECGVDIRCDAADNSILRVRAPKKLLAADVITQEYPGFATDMQAQFMALATQAEGVSHIREAIFENRMLHAVELLRMGANIHIEGNSAVVTGPTPLTGAPVTASDLRASASLVLAALVANNTTTIDRVYHIDRGYERIEEKLRGLGASIERVSPSGS
ncbi:MAG: UDP-N-acetylglucosamine 1-carboxyvinyltransferase [Acidobacteriota bacterium]|nr:UDP-N-acetylglucosamine 1-carboxyvinyltransferase [Acidobacteriota bacterium]